MSKAEEAGAWLVTGDRATGEALASACTRRGLLLDLDDPRTQAVEVDGVVVVDLRSAPTEVIDRALALIGPRTQRVVVLAAASAAVPAGLRVDATVGTDASLDEFVAVVGGIGGSNAASTPDTAPADPLTPREREILGELLAGHDTARMSERLEITEHTVRTHLQNVFGKLGVSNRAEATSWALRAGIAPAARREAVAR